MATITVNDISLYKNNDWKSIKGQQAYVNGAWKTIGNGSGVYKDGNWYVFATTPSYIVTYSTDDSRDVVDYYDFNTRIPNGGSIESGKTVYMQVISAHGNYACDSILARMGERTYYYVPFLDADVLNKVTGDVHYRALFSLLYYSLPYVNSDANINVEIIDMTSGLYDNINFQLIGTSAEGFDRIVSPLRSFEDTLTIATPWNGVTIEIYPENLSNLNLMPKRMAYTYTATNYEFRGFIERTDFLKYYEDSVGNIVKLYIGTDGINSGALKLPINANGSTLTINIVS